ncbi:uncharacterized protein BX664DRAFT_309751 [Halteromyces radiatus]|uniref:uncharacterized protein n=1 Tax=Halteromyces radiatus TaxID=101107 RepID=UPI0022210B03|nr:uncharacterized protein BX664DRAFT_309751 [Halteromyces radiatus]KAI8098703.1 hypothetical protein BX664DRAFT_309751 [Halteromyces radiatus]
MYRRSLVKIIRHHGLPVCRRNLGYSIARSFSFTTSTSSSNNEPEYSKIYALPFKLSAERAPQVMFFKSLPTVSDTSHIRIRKAYLPIWYYDMAITANVTRDSDGKERELLGVALDGFWTGHTWDPMCYLSFGFPVVLDKTTLRPFTSMYDNVDDKEDIEVIPFSTDPFQDLGDHVSKALEGVHVGHLKQAMTIGKAALAFGAAYPLYFPVYIGQVRDNKEQVIVVAGHSDNPPVFKHTPGNKGAKQWLNGGNWIRLDVTDPSWRVGAPISPLQELCKIFMDKVVNKMDEDGNPTLANTSRRPIQWDDTRIQSYVSYEKDNKTYLKQLFKVWAQQRMLSHLEGMDGNRRTFGMGADGFVVKTADQFKTEILNKIGDELETLEKVEPLWLKEYNQQQQQIMDNHTSDIDNSNKQNDM